MNSAGSSLMPTPVLDSMKQYLDLEAELGGYSVMQIRNDQIQKFYEEAAKLINTNPENIAFLFSATDAYAKAISSFSFTENDHVLITTVDYVSNYLLLIALKERYGVHIHILKNRANGALDLTDLEEKIIKYNPKLISITHVPTNSGLIQDVVSIGDICSKYPDVIYMLDACQSMGQLCVDVEKIQCDFLTTSGRKFLRGPRGTGFLYVSDRMLNNKTKPLSSDAFGSDWTDSLSYDAKPSASRYEYFEKPYASLVGLGQACAYINSLGIHNIEKECKGISDSMRYNLSGIPKVKMLDRGSVLSNIITFVKEGVGKTEAIQFLSDHKVTCGVTERFSALIDFEEKGLNWAIRVSPHYFNTLEEVERVSDLIDQL